MAYPVSDQNEKEIIKTKTTTQPGTATIPATQTRPLRVRPKVAELIDKVTKENAPTWQELAKR